jgi:hypothetical protein
LDQIAADGRLGDPESVRDSVHRQVTLGSEEPRDGFATGLDDGTGYLHGMPTTMESVMSGNNH